MKNSGEILQKLEKHIRENNAPVVVTLSDGMFLVASEWGSEAEDSPMVGAANYGLADNVHDALDQAMSHVRL